MPINLATMFQNAQKAPVAEGTPYTTNVYNPLPSNWGTENNSTMSDLQRQQNGVPQWIQNTLGINAQSMDDAALQKLNTDYTLNSVRNGRYTDYNLTDQSGKSLGTHQYYDKPFNFLQDVALPAAAVFGGGYFGANALFGGAGAAAGGGAATGGAAGAGGTSSAVGGTGLAASAPGAATGAGFNFAGAAPGAIVGTGEGLGVATGAASSAGAGLGAGIGASIPAGSALAGTALGGAGAGSGSGLASQFLGNAASTAGGGIVDAMKSIPGSNSIVSKLLGGALGGSGGISGLGNLGSLFTNYNQYKQNQDIIDQIKGIYSPTGEYAKYLEGQLGRRDAAAGRNSQYGPRLAELTGRLAEGQASNLAKLSPFMQGQQGGLNGIVGAGSRLLQGAGGVQGLLDLFKGGSQGGMVPAPTTNGGDYIPNPDYNPVDDNWWSNPQFGP